MQTGIITETKITKTRQIQLSYCVFATSNSCQNIIEPLQSRFLILEIEGFTFDEFRRIAVLRREKENVDSKTAVYITEKIWNELGSNNIRDAVKVGRLVHSFEDISSIITTITKHYKRS